MDSVLRGEFSISKGNLGMTALTVRILLRLFTVITFYVAWRVRKPPIARVAFAVCLSKLFLLVGDFAQYRASVTGTGTIPFLARVISITGVMIGVACACWVLGIFRRGQQDIADSVRVRQTP